MFLMYVVGGEQGIQQIVKVGTVRLDEKSLRVSF